MVSKLTQSELKWFAPSPLWMGPGTLRVGHSNGAVGQPTILRFATDLFMEELLQLTATEPDRLAEWVARYETWREPMPTPKTAPQLRLLEPIRSAPARDQRKGTGRAPAPFSSTADPIEQPLRLYQPAHQRHYLVAASLVCEQPGLPDRLVNRAQQEKIGFVIRRISGNPLEPVRAEYAFVAKHDGFEWKYVPEESRHLVEAGEERLPLFSISYRRCSEDRQLLAGTIPVGKREAYLSARGWPGTAGETAQKESTPGRRMRRLFETEVTAPWKALMEQVYAFELGFKQSRAAGEDDEDDQRREYRSALKALHEQVQTGSWYVLLDFAKFLDTHLNGVWRALKVNVSLQSLSEPEQALVTTIKSTALQSALVDALAQEYGSAGYSVKQTLAQALIEVRSWEEQLQDVEDSLDLDARASASGDDWPNFLFPIASPALTMDRITPDDRYFAVLPGSSGPDGATRSLEEKHEPSLEEKHEAIDSLADLVEAALPGDLEGGPELELPRASKDEGDAWFVIRCVFERPRCQLAKQVIVSNPTQPFQMAPFFEPDAPARPIRIPMPMDISPAGLRKYRKNANFVMSDMLCGRIKRIKRLTLGDLVLSVLPWPFHKDLPNVSAGGACKDGGGSFGVVCSLSIPIVTLCALILLIIIVALFDVFFKWIPFLFTCLPIPGLKGKKSS